MKAGGHEWFKPSPREQAQIDRARSFVGRHIRRHKKMGMSDKQSQAVALHEARDKGYKVPPPPMPRHVRKAEKGRYL
jgi:hypothetical protein